MRRAHWSAALALVLVVVAMATVSLIPGRPQPSALAMESQVAAGEAVGVGSLAVANEANVHEGRNVAGLQPLEARVRLHGARLHMPPDAEIERLLREDGRIAPDASEQSVEAAVEEWINLFAKTMPLPGDASARNERLALTQGLEAARPVTAAVLAIPVEFTATETLSYQVQNADASACITVTNTFTRPLHGEIPYPGGDVTHTIDNQTVFYPSTEAEDYRSLIFGREGYTVPLRAGDPNVNDGAGVDISGLTVQTYFDAQSDGTAELSGDVAPWVQVPHSEAYYGIDRCVPRISAVALPDEQIGSLADLTVLAAEGVKALGGQYASYEYWSQFDEDGDGWIDTLWIIHAGRGQEYGGGSQGAAAIWSRAGNLAAYPAYPHGYTIHDNGTPDTSDDIRIGTFSMLPEDSDIGVLVEEFGHAFFGLPDLYTMRSSNSVGWWAPMSAGIWGGELGGTRPVNMPLWYRMVADCRGEPCGWADPMKVISYTTAGETVVVGQAGTPAGGLVPDGPYAGETIYEGLRIELPDQTEVLPNLAGDGEGGGAYSGNATQENLTLSRALDLSAVTAPITLTFDSHLVVQRIWGYAYVEVSVDGGDFVSLGDAEGVFDDFDPMGLKMGIAATGDHHMQPVFDLSEFAGKQAVLRFRFLTYQGAPGSGGWIDNVNVSGGVLEEDFEDGLDAWDGVWAAVPQTLTHPHHYLVEWRNDNGFDESLRGAYQTAYHDADEWRVDRVPANVPGAVVMYRNLKYPFTGAFLDNLDDPPSYGSKYGLLVVDTNFFPTERPSGLPFSGRLESLNAPLALQDQPDFELEVREHPTDREPQSTETITGSEGVELFNDALGYYPGLKAFGASEPELWDMDASVVVPSLGDRAYTTRVTWPDKSRPHPLDGTLYEGHQLGSGNPGDANAHFGVHIEVIDQADDGSWGVLRVYNSAVDYDLTASTDTAMPGQTVTYTVRAANRGAIEVTGTYTLSLPGGAVNVGSYSAAPGELFTATYTNTLPLQVASDDLHAEVVFYDGANAWQRSVELAPPQRIMIPLAKKERP
jgi:immune inhibitor A